MKFREVKGLVQSDAGVRIHLRFLAATLHPFPSVLLQSFLTWLLERRWMGKRVCVCTCICAHGYFSREMVSEFFICFSRVIT